MECMGTMVGLINAATARKAAAQTELVGACVVTGSDGVGGKGANTDSGQLHFKPSRLERSCSLP
eukprot:1473523-Rhodomonas_salina.1